MAPEICGRVVAKDGAVLVVKNEHGAHKVKEPGDARVGDIVCVDQSGVHVLTRGRGDFAQFESTLDPRRQHAMRTRERTESLVRGFFSVRGFRETRTPLLVQNPGMEAHIDPVRTASGAFLPTSPEFAMKQLLVGGLQKIFQLAPAFRQEPISKTHLPEFTLLEWYRAYAYESDIMNDTEELIAELCTKVLGAPAFVFQGQTVSVSPPWPRLRVRDLFREHASIDLAHAALSSNDFFQTWLDRIEPKLPPDRAVFVTEYPPEHAALAVIDTDNAGNHFARRFEVFAGGLELANAFCELTDAAEQRARFARDSPGRAMPEVFLDALEQGMPPSGGIALGIDRLVMLLADEPDVRKTVWLDPVVR